MAAKRQTALQLWGKELARARETAGMSGGALAKAIYVSNSLVGMWETGKRVPKQQDINRCDTTLGTNGYLARLLSEWVSREVPPEWLGQWRSIEELATTLLSFQPTVVPGLLQTPDYARAVLRAGIYHHADTDEMVATRIERQRILTEGDPPFLVALMDESVLHRNAGGAEIMGDQLTHLAEIAARRNVVVQVVPLTATACAGFLSPFVVASFDGGNEVAYVDNQLRGEVVEHPDEVATLRQLFELFRAEALSTKESIELITRVAKQWTP